jgi:hypothetical protein
MKNWIIEQWRSLSRWAWKGRKPAAYRTERIAELPEKLHKRRLYVMGISHPWAVAMLCPCGCGSVIQLSLLETDSPRWRLSVDRKGIPTLAPSVYRTQGCKSHFFLRAGRIDWCNW